MIELIGLFEIGDWIKFWG